MSEENVNEAPEQEVKEAASSDETNQEATKDDVELQGCYLEKVGMSAIYEEGVRVPVTVLKYNPAVVTQIKTKEKDGYEAVQIGFYPKRAKNTSKSEKGHLKNSGFENGARVIKEVRQSTEGITVAKKVSIETFKKGDLVRLTGKSKGRGFSGVMKRWGHGGGPASHGSGFHRRPGSIGNCTFPGRVMKNRKMPGQYGNETKTLPRVKIVDVLPEENVVLVKGPVPGSKKSLVKMMKV